MATRYELLNAIILAWNSIFHVRLHTIGSAKIHKHISFLLKFKVVNKFCNNHIDDNEGFKCLLAGK